MINGVVRLAVQRALGLDVIGEFYQNVQIRAGFASFAGNSNPESIEVAHVVGNTVNDKRRMAIRQGQKHLHGTVGPGEIRERTVATGGLNTSKYRDQTRIYRASEGDKPLKTRILVSLTGKITGGWPRARPVRRWIGEKTKPIPLEPASAVQTDEASDQIQLAAIVAFDHAAEGPAGVHDGRGWVIPVGIEKQNAERGGNTTHPVAGRRPSCDVNPQRSDPGIGCFNKRVVRTIAASDLHFELEVFACQRNSMVQSISS